MHNILGHEHRSNAKQVLKSEHLLTLLINVHHSAPVSYYVITNKLH